MQTSFSQPRILIITPEAAFVPAGLVNRRHCQRTLESGVVAILSKLVSDLCEQGVDVHVAQPDYRRIYVDLVVKKRNLADSKLPADRLHLAEDRVFFYSNPIHTNNDWQNTEIALDFQREISHQILPRVQPDLIHCHDWMTGLIPAVAKHRGIPCLFSAFNFRSAGSLLSKVEDRGIDAAAIWQYLYYDRYPGIYQEIRDSNPLDFLLSGILSARHVNTTGISYLTEASKGQRDAFLGRLMQLLQKRHQTGSISELPHTCICPENLRQHHSPTPYTNHDTIDRKGHRPISSLGVGKDSPLLIQEEAAQWICKLYEKILARPLVAAAPIIGGEINKNDRQKAINGQRSEGIAVHGVNSYRFTTRRKTSPATVT
ncbi:MAG: glycogen/starch synthase [Desulfobacterales bacterium]|nr:MAG: glycogen/starch synthase [Desulfobacterales bacterium]